MASATVVPLMVPLAPPMRQHDHRNVKLPLHPPMSLRRWTQQMAWRVHRGSTVCQGPSTAVESDERALKPGKCIPITIGPGIYQEHMNEALDVLSNGGCVWVIFLQGNISGENRITCANLETFNLGHTMLIKGAHGRVRGGICKSVIRSGRLSVKLPNPPASLGSTPCGLGSKFPSLHSCIHSLKEKIAQDDQPIRRLKWGTANLIARAPITPIVLPIVHSGFEKVMPEKSFFGR